MDHYINTLITVSILIGVLVGGAVVALFAYVVPHIHIIWK